MGDPKEKTCAICGKEIYAGEDWAYKRKIHGERTLWFCSYKCMRIYDAKTEGPKKPRTETEAPPAPPKEPTSRADQAKALAREILAGRSVIAWLKKEGYKNPHEAYSAVRHYAQTKMPELAETLKPLKDLPKAPPAARTGRPRKQRPVVERVDLVPEVEPGKNVPTLEELREIAETPEPDPEPVQCIAHVTDAEIEEAEQAVADLILQGGVNYQVKIDEAGKAEEKEKKPGFQYEIKTIETEIGEFSYDRKAHLLIFRRRDEEKEFGYQYLSMSTREWDRLLIIVPQLADLMGVTL